MMLGWWKEGIHLKEESRSVQDSHGERCAVMDGITTMPQLYVSSLATRKVCDQQTAVVTYTPDLRTSIRKLSLKQAHVCLYISSPWGKDASVTGQSARSRWCLLKRCTFHCIFIVSSLILSRGVHFKYVFKITIPICSLGGIAVKRPGFGEGSGFIMMTEVGCTGQESQLVDCPFSNMTDSCKRYNRDDVGVVCITGWSLNSLFVGLFVCCLLLLLDGPSIRAYYHGNQNYAGQKALLQYKELEHGNMF